MKAASRERTNRPDVGPQGTCEAGGRSICASPSKASSPTVPSRLSVDRLPLPSLLSSNPRLLLPSRSCLWCSVLVQVTAAPPPVRATVSAQGSIPDFPTRPVPAVHPVPFPSLIILQSPARFFRSSLFPTLYCNPTRIEPGVLLAPYGIPAAGRGAHNLCGMNDRVAEKMTK